MTARRAPWWMFLPGRNGERALVGVGCDRSKVVKSEMSVVALRARRCGQACCQAWCASGERLHVKEGQMRRLTLVVVGVGAVVGTAAMPPRTARAQEKTNAGLRLSVVGIAVKDYPKSQNFYEKIMGFPVAFTFS